MVAIAASTGRELLFPANDKYKEPPPSGIPCEPNNMVSPGTAGVCTMYQLAWVEAGAGLELGVTCNDTRSPGTKPAVSTKSHT
jgi:hypothetical protein